MADYSWAYERHEDSKTKEIMAQQRLKELREGYVTNRNATHASYCIRCGCVVGDRKVHDGVCPWNEEMLQAGLDKLNETGEL